MLRGDPNKRITTQANRQNASHIKQACRQADRGNFSRALRRLGAPPSLKNTGKGVPGGFFLTTTLHKIHFRPGSVPDPAGGGYDAPQAPSQMVRGHPSPRFLPRLNLGAYGMRLWYGPTIMVSRALLWLSTGLI